MAQWTRAKAEALAPVVERIEALIRASPRALPRRSFDDAQDGQRVGGRTQWLHTAAARPSPSTAPLGKRGELPEGPEGRIVVHDGFKPYRNLDGVARPPAHALCNAHPLRELKALIEFDNEPWAEKMRDCL